MPSLGYAFNTSFEDGFDSPFADVTPPDPGQIPPDSILGPIAARLPEIVARVAQNLHIELPDDWVTQAVDAAVIFVIDRTNRNDLGLPADALTVSGLIGFSTRIHQDAFSPNGAQVAVGDSSFEPMYLPENLWKHWRHYFTRLNPRWGIG